MKVRQLILSLCILVSGYVHPQVSTISSDFEFGINKGKEIISFPFSSPNKFFRDAGATAIVTGLLFTLDNPVRDFAHSNQNSFNDNLFSVDKYYGNAYTVILSAAIYSTGLLSQSNKWRKAGLNSVVSLFYSGIINQTLKRVIGRHRPYMNDGIASFSPSLIENDFFSLPSGHTTAAFAFSTAMAESIDNTYWDIFWYSLAGLTAASRIYHDQHWLSDTFLGAVIGYAIGKFVSAPDSIKEDSNLTFAFTEKGVGLFIRLD